MFGKDMTMVFDDSFFFLQRREIAESRNCGLDEEQIRLFAKHCYNHEQMHEIRLALEHGYDRNQIKAMLRSDIVAEDMRDMRKRIEHGEIVKRKQSAAGLLKIVFLFLLILFVILFSWAGRNDSRLDLKTDTVVLKKGEVFEPMAYVSSYAGRKGRLILPEVISTEKQGTQIVVYRLQCGGQEIRKTLRVEIIE